MQKPTTRNTRYEVESELNPRYMETGNSADYYGIYRVVMYINDVRGEIVKTFDDGAAHARRDAYRLAGQLTKAH